MQQQPMAQRASSSDLTRTIFLGKPDDQFKKIYDIAHAELNRYLSAEKRILIAGVENHHNFAWLEEHGGRHPTAERGAGLVAVIPIALSFVARVMCSRSTPNSVARIRWSLLNSASPAAIQIFML